MDLNENSLLKVLIDYNQLSQKQIDQLLTPKALVTSNHPSFLNAKSLIMKAIQNQEKIMVFGDYDADGLCGTSILIWTLRKLGCEPGFYIPNRFSDGYGLNTQTTQLALSKGYRFFITVDNGVSAHDALQLINEAHASCIVVDHHLIHEDVQCSQLIHPDYLEDGYTTLCGSGLAHQLSRHLIGEEPYLDVLAGIATLADMMPLWDHNRSLVQHALRLLNQNTYPNIHALLKKTNEPITEDDLSFQLIPKLNAVGRLADLANPNRVVDYLCSNDFSQIEHFAQQMEHINQQRKEIHQSMYNLALTKDLNDAVLMIEDEHFHEGVVGITAGKLAQTFKKPSVVFNNNGARLKGSARSYGSIDLQTLFEPALDLLTRFGGHASAAGIELDLKDFDAFKDRILNHYRAEDKVYIQDGIPFQSSWAQIKQFEDLKIYGPFGMGFRIPNFIFAGVMIKERKSLKNGFKYRIEYQECDYELLDFNGTTPLPTDTTVDVWAKVQVSTFRDQKQLSLWLEAWT